MATRPIVTDDLIERVAHGFRLRDEARVRAFLGEHPQLVPLSLEVHDAAPRYMGPETAIPLEVVSDPEAKNAEELYALVQTRLAPDQALDKLHEFDRHWWIERVPRAGGKLTVIVEYV